LDDFGDGFGGNLFLLEEINRFQTRNRQHFSSRRYGNNEILKLQADVEVPKGTNGRGPNGPMDRHGPLFTNRSKFPFKGNNHNVLLEQPSPFRPPLHPARQIDSSPEYRLKCIHNRHVKLRWLTWPTSSDEPPGNHLRDFHFFPPRALSSPFQGPPVRLVSLKSSRSHLTETPQSEK